MWRGGHHGEPELLAGAYRACLRLCDELGAETLALPAISMGAYGYPSAAGAKVAVDAVAAHLAGSTRLRIVRFVIFSEPMHSTFASAVRSAPRG